MENEILLECQDLVKTFGAVRAVDGLSLQVGAGEMVGLVGPDGAGKTTAIRLFCGALQPTSGSIRVAGFTVPGQVEKAREKIGYLAQRFSLYGDLTVKENLDFFGEVFDIPNAERETRSRDLLRFAGLEEFSNRPAAALSGGMQKKLGLASALVHRPKVLLLDEPTGGVDPSARQEFWHLLINLLREGSAVLVSTPYMDEATRFNRVVFMNHGKALIQGAPRELIGQLTGRILELAAEPQAAARKIATDRPGGGRRARFRRLPAPARPLTRRTAGPPPGAAGRGRGEHAAPAAGNPHPGGCVHAARRDGKRTGWKMIAFH